MAVDKEFYLFLTGVFLNFCAVSGMYVLVSSFNVDEGLGTWSLALGYGASLFTASLTPLVGYIIGCKRLLIFSEVGYLLFLVGNCYTSYYTVLPAGLFLGLSEGWAWTAMPIITTYFAEKRASADHGSKEKHNRYYTGYFYGAAKAAPVVGNALSFVVLHVDRSLSTQYNDTSLRPLDYSYCGADDCQISNVTQAMKGQYETAFPLTKYLITALYCLLTMGAVLLHAVYLPKNIRWELETAINVETSDNCNVDEQLTAENNQEMQRFTKRTDDSAFEDLGSSPQPPKVKVSPTTLIRASLRATLNTAFSPKHVLVALLPIFSGMNMGYSAGELTRSYTSCMLGVDKVGICVMLYSAFDCISAMVAGRVAGKVGRNIPFFVAFLLDLGLFVFSLLWQPEESNVWLVYLMFTLFGITDGVWVTLITAMYGEYFIEEQKVAYNLWNVVTNVGFLVQYSISTALCIYAKIYLQIIVMCLAIVTYGISQFVYYPHEVCSWRASKPSYPQAE